MARNWRPPPDQLARTELNQVSAWCRYDPGVCLVQVGVEALFILLSYCALLYLTGGAVPGPLDIAKFLASFSVLNIAARLISDDLGNKLSISAVSGIGNKCVSMLASKFVSW